MSEVGQENRVILLGKSLTRNNDNLERAGVSGQTPSLISLGFFDSLQIYPLPKNDLDGNWLADMWEHSVQLSGETTPDLYYHPLYITLSSDKEILDGFWKKNKTLLFVSLVHFSTKDETGTNEDRFKTVSERIASILTQSKEEVDAACYQSINLSDMVVIWKSDSVLAIMTILNRLYHDEEIGDLRTICSFPPLTNLPSPLKDERIPYVSVRFGVSSAKDAARFEALMKENFAWWQSSNGYFVTGTEDLDYVFYDCKATEVIKAISSWFENPEINACMKKAFYEVSTRLGVDNVSPAGSQSIQPNPPEGKPGNFPLEQNRLTKICTNLFTDFQTMRGGERFSWYKPVSNQLNSLVNMSRICVLDGFCYLILDGASTFCKKVKPYLLDDSKNIELPNALVSRIQRFIRGWGTLVDQAIRVDGQFIQSPGFSPLLYDIPVNLLEFYIAFTKRCMSLMQSLEQKSQRYHYSLFLLPKLCNRTNVRDVFQDPPPSDRLLYVDIPLDIVYDPRQIVLQLCHEIAHYCGEKFRCRKKRAHYFMLTCAHLIAWYLKLGNIAAVQKIYNDICARVPDEKRAYMEDLVSSVKLSIVALLQDSDVYQTWQNAYLDGTNLSDKDKSVWRRQSTVEQRFFMQSRLSDLEDFSEDITRITRLFKECYADVSMLFLLRPSWDEYISLYRQELLWLDFNQTSQRAELVQRAAIALLAANYKSDALPEERDILYRFSADICSLFNDSKDGLRAKYPDDLPSQMLIGYFPLDLLQDILDYLKDCYQEMKQLNDKSEEEIRQLRAVFNKVIRENRICCEEYQQTLTWYEKQLLDSLE